MNNKTPSFQSSNQEDFNSDTFDYKGWRERFIITILRIASVLGVALIAISFPTATFTDRSSVFQPLLSFTYDHHIASELYNSRIRPAFYGIYRRRKFDPCMGSMA